MKNTPDCLGWIRLARIAFAVAILLGLNGCFNTIASRSKEKEVAFAAATPSQRETIKQGWIDYNFTPDLVYIALGKPDHQRTQADGTVEWVYMNYAADAPNAMLGAVKINGYQTKDGSTTGGAPNMRVKLSDKPDTRNRTNFETIQDVGNTAPAEEIPELHVYFYNGRTNNVRFKRGA